MRGAARKKEFEDDILEGLKWLGIGFIMPGVARQSERLEVYRKYFKTLLDKGLAYEAEASLDDPNKKVVRFKNPNIKLTFNDLVRGEVTFDTSELKDFVIARNKEEPLYHLAVVIDDHEMGITHVIRGEDHISNTPRQILILEALGFKRPEYAHIPLILAPDRSKLSKRHGSVAVSEYKRMGFLPEAFVNYLALLGWNPGTEEEFWSLEELGKVFDLSRVQKSGAIFDLEKMKWFNREYIKRLPEKEFEKKVLEFLPQEIGKWQLEKSEVFNRLLPELKERLSIFSDVKTLAAEGELQYFFEKPVLEAGKFVPPKKEKEEIGKGEIATHLENVVKLGESLGEDQFSKEGIKEVVFPYATTHGKGRVLWPMRYALSGKEKSPDPFTLAYILGKKHTLERLKEAIAILKN